MTLQEFLDQIEWLMPGREVTGLFFGVSFHAGYMESNEFVAREAQSRPGNFSEMVTPPDLARALAPDGQGNGFSRHQGLSHPCAQKAHVEFRDFAVLE